MPITVPAHQAVVLPLKMRWPRLFDATALCVGSAAPDLGYVVAGQSSHLLPGAVLFALPFTLVVTALLRWRIAATAFANLPDLGPFRLRSYRAVATRRPALVVTVVSAVVGVGSHILLDAFTHQESWGAALVNFDHRAVDIPFIGRRSYAAALQYLGHTVGSAVGLLLFGLIGHRRMVERWYGADVVARARTVAPSALDRLRFWGVAAVVAVAVVPFLGGPDHRPVFDGVFAVTLGLLVAGLVGSRRVSTVAAPGPGTDAGTGAAAGAPRASRRR